MSRIGTDLFLKLLKCREMGHFPLPRASLLTGLLGARLAVGAHRRYNYANYRRHSLLTNPTF